MTSNITSTHYGSTHRFTGRQGGSETVLLKAGANEMMNIDLNGGLILNSGSSIFGVVPDAYILSTMTTLLSSSTYNNINSNTTNLSSTFLTASATNTLTLYGSLTNLYGSSSLNLYSSSSILIHAPSVTLKSTTLTLSDTTSIVANKLESFCASSTETHNNVTGDSTTYEIGWRDPIYDNLPPGTYYGSPFYAYTIAHTGIYTLYANIMIANINSAHVNLDSYFKIERIVALDPTTYDYFYYSYYNCNPYVVAPISGYHHFILTYTGPLYESDRITVPVTVTGGTKTVSVIYSKNIPGLFSVTYHRNITV